MASADTGLTDYTCDTDALEATAATLSSSLVAHDEMGAEERALDIIRRTAAVFPPEKIAITFNGGKDAVVTLELILRAQGIDWVKRCCVFVLLLCDNEFRELSAFREEYMATRVPGVVLHEIDAKDGMRSGLWRALKRFEFAAVFMGTRKDDPGGRHQLTPWRMTTPGWPPMVRVCPILSWTFDDVWNYTLQKNIPRCPLYAQGYTSLGDSRLTSPNTNLRRADGTYDPAWRLPRGTDERAGRLDGAATTRVAPASSSNV